MSESVPSEDEEWKTKSFETKLHSIEFFFMNCANLKIKMQICTVSTPGTKQCSKCFKILQMNSSCEASSSFVLPARTISAGKLFIREVPLLVNSLLAVLPCSSLVTASKAIFLVWNFFLNFFLDVWPMIGSSRPKKWKAEKERQAAF